MQQPKPPVILECPVPADYNPLPSASWRRCQVMRDPEGMHTYRVIDRRKTNFCIVYFTPEHGREERARVRQTLLDLYNLRWGGSL